LKTNWSSVAKGNSCILRDHKINYKDDNSRPLVPTLKKEIPDSVQIFIYS